MKKRFLVLIQLLVFFSLFLYADSETISETIHKTISKTFDLYFIKSGETSFNITNSAHSSSLDKIDFSIWDGAGTNGTIPTAEFGVVWEIYRGTSYKITLDFNSSLDLSGDSMLVSAEGNRANYYAVATISGKEISNEEKLKKIINSNNTLNTSEASLVLINSTKGEYEMASGKAVVNLTMIPNTSEGDNFFMDGTYNGYVLLTVETES